MALVEQSGWESQWFKENLTFMLKEIEAQIDDTELVIRSGDPEVVEKINERDRLIDNYRGMIENHCYDEILGFPPDQVDERGKRHTDLIRGINIISENLERISDCSVSVANQTRYLSGHRYIKKNFNSKEFFVEVRKSLRRVKEALFKSDISLALKICKSEHLIDKAYAERFKQVLNRLDDERESGGDLVTSLFIFHYLERMGDAILNIGEAIILSIIGIRLKIYQFQGLEESLTQKGVSELTEGLKIDPIWGTRSGCRIMRVEANDGQTSAIFKEGPYEKLEREKENIELWNDLYKGIAPKVFSLGELFPDAGEGEFERKRGISLIQNFSGKTLKDIVLEESEELFETALRKTLKRTRNLWRQTSDPEEKVRAKFVSQLQGRISEVFRTHPGLNDLDGPGEQELEKLKKLEKKVGRGIAIWSHGDFNIDNIIFNESTSSVHYIDLHRSGTADYVQDLSVFIVSAFRIPNFDRPTREKLNHTATMALSMGQEFALENGDTTFAARLAFGLARSFITSTRFEYTNGFSQEMFQRAAYLIERLSSFEKPWERFQLPERIICLEIEGEASENWRHWSEK